MIALALSSLGGLSQELLYVHMVEHLLLGDIASLLIVLGLTGPLLAPVLRIRFFDRLRVLTHPAVALPAVGSEPLRLAPAGALPGGAAARSAIHALEHAMFLGFGIAMWMPLFGPLPTPSWFGNLGKLFYIVAVRLTGTVLGNVFLWSGTVFYPFYMHGDALAHISAVHDQNLAGAIMMVEESFLTLGLFCWLFLRAAREGEERQELLDFADAQWPGAHRGAGCTRRRRRARTRPAPPSGGGLGRPRARQLGRRRRRPRLTAHAYASDRERRPAPCRWHAG